MAQPSEGPHLVVVSFTYPEFSRLLGADVGQRTVVERLPMMGTDLERVDGATIDVEIFPNRPDLYSVEGIARGMRAFLGIAPGLRPYGGDPPTIDLAVDPSVLPVRPWIVGAVLHDVRFTDEVIRSAIDIQEKLHGTLGRDRAKVAIGLHDLDTVRPPFTYAGADPDSVRFIPLGLKQELSMREILVQHDKGKAYAHLLAKASRYPLITDRDGTVLSFPPVINGVRTAVTEGTRNVFVDITGMDLPACKTALNVIVCLLADRGARIEKVNVHHPQMAMLTPDLDANAAKVDVAKVNGLLELSLSGEEMAAALRRMGHGAEAQGTQVRVLSPCYRNDLLHPVDLAEDVAIGYGFERFTGTLPRSASFGEPHGTAVVLARARRTMIALGFAEAITFTLTNPADQYERSGLRRQEYAEVANPKGSEHTTLRTSLIPGLLATLRANKHRDLPQRFFEAGDVVVRAKNQARLGAVAVHEKASFTEAKSLVERIAKDLGRALTQLRAEEEGFIPGRVLSLDENGKHVGLFGEVHPKVIVGWELAHPVIAFELHL